VLDILLARPDTARFIAAKMWREFVSPTPDPAEVERWAAVLRSAHYEVKPLLHAVFLSDAFWSPDNRATLVKSPVDVVVGTLHMLDVRPNDLRPAAVACAVLGQNLFAPPNVKGWPGGDAWIDSATLLGRRQFVERVFGDVKAAAIASGLDARDIDRLVLASAAAQPPAANVDGAARLRALVSDPVYQLK
jgi:uncharacterized protein (DUF1800 family)